MFDLTGFYCMYFPFSIATRRLSVFFLLYCYPSIWEWLAPVQGKARSSAPGTSLLVFQPHTQPHHLTPCCCTILPHHHAAQPHDNPCESNMQPCFKWLSLWPTKWPVSLAITQDHLFATPYRPSTTPVWTSACQTGDHLHQFDFDSAYEDDECKTWEEGAWNLG